MRFFPNTLWLLSGALAAAVAPAADKDRFALPTDKAHLPQCQREALARHPGTIATQQMLHQEGKFLVRYEIEAPDGKRWVVLCDGSTGTLVGEQKVMEEAAGGELPETGGAAPATPPPAP